MKPAALAAARLITADAGTFQTTDAVAADNVRSTPTTVIGAGGYRPGNAIIRRKRGRRRAKPGVETESSRPEVARSGQTYSGTDCCCSGVSPTDVPPDCTAYTGGRIADFAIRDQLIDRGPGFPCRARSEFAMPSLRAVGVLSSQSPSFAP